MSPPPPGESVRVGEHLVEHRVCSCKPPAKCPRFVIRDAAGEVVAMGRRWRWCLARLGVCEDDQPARRGSVRPHWSERPEHAERARRERADFAWRNQQEIPF